MTKAMDVFCKLAQVGPAIIYDQSFATGPTGAKYVTAKAIKAALSTTPGLIEEVARLPKRWKTEGILILAPKGSLPGGPYATGKELQKAFTRHELTHYLRYKRGKHPGVPKMGLKGVVTTAREELVAHTEMMKALPRVPLLRKIKGIIQGTAASMKLSYPQGVLKAIMKLAQTSSKLHWYGPSHPRAKAIRGEFARAGSPVSARFPVATDTSRTVITLMGYRGTGLKASVIRKKPGTSSRDTLGLGAAKTYLYSVADSRGYQFHGMNKWRKK